MEEPLLPSHHLQRDAPSERDDHLPPTHKSSPCPGVTPLLYALCVTSIAIFALYLVTDLPFNPAPTPHKRNSDSVWMEALTTSYNHTTVYTLNYWYQYAKYVAESQGRSNCYVCTHMPIAASNPKVIPLPLPPPIDIFPDTLRSYNDIRFLRKIIWHFYRIDPKPLRAPALHVKNRTLIKTPANPGREPIFGPVHIRPGTKFTCYAQPLHRSQIIATTLTSDPTYVGQVPSGFCSVTFVPCTSLPNSPELNDTQAPPGTKCAPYFSVPDIMGTLPTEGHMFLCGYSMYDSLPKFWIGRCAAVLPADHSFIVSATPHPSEATQTSNVIITHSRQKRAFLPHDSITGSDVPQDFKLWTTAQKVMLSLFPQVGVGKLLLRMETLNYRFSGFVNTTISILESERLELNNLRAVALQNRIVLDQLTAAAGGVCAMIDTACCTYIPANDEDGAAIQQGINNLTQLAKTLHGDTIEEKPSWLAQLFSSWHALLINSAIALLAALIFFSCVIPCIIKSVNRMVSSQYLAMTTASTQMTSASADMDSVCDSDSDLEDGSDV